MHVGLDQFTWWLEKERELGHRMEKLTKRQGRGKIRMNFPAIAHPHAAEFWALMVLKMSFLLQLSPEKKKKSAHQCTALKLIFTFLPMCTFEKGTQNTFQKYNVSICKCIADLFIFLFYRLSCAPGQCCSNSSIEQYKLSWSFEVFFCLFTC